MARKFRVTVDGEAFEVEVEELGAEPRVRSVSPAVQAVSRPAATPAPAPAPAPKQTAPKPAASAAPVTDGRAVTAPLPGTVTAVRVETGDRVTAGQTVCVLEAMKMENEIPAPTAGTVKQILVSKGQTVAGGAPLLVIAED